MLACVGRAFEIDFQPSLSCTRSFVTPFCFKSVFITSPQVFLGLPLPTSPGTWIFLHLLIQEVSGLLCTWPNQLSLLFCKQVLMLSNGSLLLSSSELTLSFKDTLHIHRIILISFLSMHCSSFALTGQISLPCNIAIRTHAWYSLPFVEKGIALLVNKGKISLNFNQPAWE